MPKAWAKRPEEADDEDRRQRNHDGQEDADHQADQEAGEEPRKHAVMMRGPEQIRPGTLRHTWPLFGKVWHPGLTARTPMARPTPLMAAAVKP